MLDGFHADGGLDPLYARHLGDFPAQQSIQLRDARHEHMHQIVGLPCGGKTLQDGRMLRYCDFKLRVMSGADGDVHVGMHVQPQSGRVQLRPISLDHSVAL